MEYPKRDKLFGDQLSPFSALMNMDTFTELCSPSISDQFLLSFNGGDASLVNPTSSQSGFCLRSPEMEDSGKNQCSSPGYGFNSVPKTVVGVSLAEKLLKALSLFKESSGGGILAQIWMPFKQGDEYILSTSEQPYLLDEILAGYREISRTFTFSGRQAPGSVIGLPGRVFISGMPEWTSNVVYYNPLEYLRVDHALAYEVRGSLAVPIFDSGEPSCCAVLELVTKKEKSDFDTEMDSVCCALQAVNLTSVRACAQQQNLKEGQKYALSEIMDVMRVICHAHMLPLALTWVPFRYVCRSTEETVKSCIGEQSSNLDKEIMLCIEESACYVNDQQMQGFLHACSEHYLQKGQGIAGKAIESNHPIFTSDVKASNVHHYPLAHHARKYGLHAAVAVRVRSTYTGSDDYILEFFLPTNCKGSAEQQLLLNNLGVTLRRICRSLRTVSGDEVVCTDLTKDGINKESENSQTPEASLKSSEDSAGDTKLDSTQMKCGSPRHQKKRRSAADKNIDLSVLQQYYTGTLKDAAKSIGVCPTTLKRICRLNGISRWPSRKISKVNHSMKKIQTVIESVPGVTGTLKYDPKTGNFTAEVSSPEEQITSKSMDASVPEQIVATMEPENLLATGHQIADSARSESLPGELSNPHVSSSFFSKQYEMTTLGRQPNFVTSRGGLGTESLMLCNRLSNLSSEVNASDRNKCSDKKIIEPSHPANSSMTDSSSGSASSGPILKEGFEKTTVASNCGSIITVKATYKEDTIRFKFAPSLGCYQLFEEIGKRLKLSTGTFQLKYLDDEGEWVMLVNNSDLQECVEILELTRTKFLKIQVRDIPFHISSSGSSNSLLLTEP
ncbi:protein NLP2 [Typha angustifolia]|uniref:protein NLP2 n=1 Tax=Typha angustifolia TaxID=59011 RepID=UPI003C307FBE